MDHQRRPEYVGGDKIITVNGENIAGIGLSNRKIFDMLRGPRGSEVTIGVKRRGEEELVDFKLKKRGHPSIFCGCRIYGRR